MSKKLSFRILKNGCATVLLLNFVFYGCGGAGGVASTPPNEPSPQGDGSKTDTNSKFDIEAMMAREIEPLNEAEVADDSGGWTGAIEASGSPTLVREESYIEITSSVGTSENFKCYVYDDPMDPAATLQAMIQSASQNVDFKNFETDVKVVNETGVILFEGLYVANQAEQKLVGLFKIALFAHGAHSASCIHDEVGYRETFERISLKFFESLQLQNPDKKEKLDYVRVWTLSMNDAKIGFARETLQPGDQNGLLYIDSSHMFLPLSPSQLKAVDAYTVEKMNKNGFLREQTHIQQDDGENTSRITVNRVKGKRYNYEGRHKGEEVAGEFKSKNQKGLWSQIRVWRELRKAATSGKKKRFLTEGYSPTRHVEQLSTAEYIIERGENRSHFTLVQDNQNFAGTTDQYGIMDHLEFSVGNLRVKMVRVFERGSF